MNYFEITILEYIHSLISCSILDLFFKYFTLLGNKGAVWIVISVVFIIFKKTRKCGITMAIGLILCLLLGNITLKPLIARIRPFDVKSALDIIISKPTDFSFPSGHTFASFASALIIFKHYRKWGVFAIIFASLMAFSRIYLLVHYPTDVFGGIALGIIISKISNTIYYKYIERKIQ